MSEKSRTAARRGRKAVRNVSDGGDRASCGAAHPSPRSLKRCAAARFVLSFFGRPRALLLRPLGTGYVFGCHRLGRVMFHLRADASIGGGGCCRSARADGRGSSAQAGAARCGGLDRLGNERSRLEPTIAARESAARPPDLAPTRTQSDNMLGARKNLQQLTRTIHNRQSADDGF